MACTTSFELYHNFPKLAEESGFTFNTHRPRVHIEWNKIRLIDIEGLIKERKFVLIEQHINDILDCVLESEFDVRILDVGVLKIFRLAQLAVEYQQFCRHYLDRSVYVLREEVTALAQQLESTKRVLKEKEEEIRKLRRRSKSAFRTSLPYGNDNIATMILKTLNNKSDIFPTLSYTDTMQHNKCTYCDKVFLNQLYLQSHMSRRHANVLEIPQKDIDSNQHERSHDENVKLHNELSELRSKLADMEQLVTNLKNTTINENNFSYKNTDKPTATSNETDAADVSKLADVKQLVTNLKNTTTTEHNINDNEPTFSKEMKDAGISTNGEGYILDKIEEWKKEEREKYNKEINLLRTQIMSMLDSFKEKEETAKHDFNNMDELLSTIKQQGLEIMTLKQELTNYKSSPNIEEIAQRKEIEAQMSYWVKRAELQSNEYKLLLQKLDVVAKEAQKARTLAETERIRVVQLQKLLQEKNELPKSDDKNSHNANPAIPEINTTDSLVSNKPKANLIQDRISIKKLQQKAQELLDLENTSTSDNSASSNGKITKTEKNKFLKAEKKYNTNHKSSPIKQKNRMHKRKTKASLSVTETPNYMSTKLAKNKSTLQLKDSLHSEKENGTTLPGSPKKIIRAKITEEVNNRLVALGVDPLKTRLPENIFSKQKLQLQEQQELKFKKYPGSEQLYHTLITQLDSNVITVKNTQTSEYHNSATKNTKPLSLSSVISNVKTKALSLVKSNDHSRNDYKSYDSVAKKAMMLLRTPSSSTNSSPKLQALEKNSPAKAMEFQNSIEKKGNNTKTKIQRLHDHTQETVQNFRTDTESTGSESNEREQVIKHNRASATIENLVKTPTRRPSDQKKTNYALDTENKNITPITPKTVVGVKSNGNLESTETNQNSSDNGDSLIDQVPKRAYSVDNITKLTKGVLKNASSTSSLSKKKVIFDMDAIQMKSVSASSPSQSITEKIGHMEKYGLGLVKLDNEEWDISSIENEPVEKNPVISRTSPKIAELKETIESQLTRRNNTISTVLVGGVDVLSAPLNKASISNKGGSNTSLGSSILDETDSTPAQNQVAFVKPRTFIEKDDSEIDLSEFVTDELITKNTKVIKT